MLNKMIIEALTKSNYEKVDSFDNLNFLSKKMVILKDISFAIL